MYLSEELQKKWEPVLAHQDLAEIKDPYKRAVTTVVLETKRKLSVRKKLLFSKQHTQMLQVQALTTMTQF